MHIIDKSDIIRWLPDRPKDSYKGSMGRVLCVGGNTHFGGAIILAASAAVYSGAGLTSVASDPINLHALHARLPEAMFLDYQDFTALEDAIHNADTVLLGPGLGRDAQAEAIFHCVLSAITKQKLVLDADALYFISQNHPNLPQTTVIATPHQGEWLRLTGLPLSESTVEQRQQATADLGMWVVLKSERTEIYLDDTVYQNPGGNPAMATGGMGDVLAGMLAGLLGQYSSPKETVLSGVFLHSYIADQLALNQYVTLPSQIVTEIPRVMRELLNAKQQF